MAMYRVILAPLDGSKRAERALPHAEAIAGRFGARLLLLRVTKSPGSFVVRAASPPAALVHPAGVVDPTAIVEAERQEAASYLGAMETAVRRQGLDVSTRQEMGSPAE